MGYVLLLLFRLISNMSGATAVLLSAGFEFRGDKLELTRFDPALLYLSHSFVDMCLLTIIGN